MKMYAIKIKYEHGKEGWALNPRGFPILYGSLCMTKSIAVKLEKKKPDMSDGRVATARAAVVKLVEVG